MEILWFLLIPLGGTVLGSSLVYLLKDKMSVNLQKTFLGFASGVMVAASIWSLVIPAIELEADKGKWAFFPAGIGILVGFIFLLFLDSIIPHLHRGSKTPEGVTTSKVSKSTMMVLAVTIHNFPEGMTVGVAIAAALAGQKEITSLAALSMALGIALQNFPEGACVALPLRVEGKTKHQSFLLGSLTGIVEPIASLICIGLTSLMISILPYLLGFAAGAMLYVVVDELIPDAQQGKHSNIATMAFAVGFVIMMILDITLG